MEWTRRVYEHGETRQRTRFILVPMRIHKDGFFRWKWLTRATWIEKCEAFRGDNYWYPIKWID